LTLTNSIVSGNAASFYGGGIYNETAARMTIGNSVVSGNSAPVGGGIANHDGTLSLSSSTVSGNSGNGMYGSGGGIFNGGLGGSVDVTTSTVSYNSASGQGGGIYIGSGTLSVVNSTVSNNSSSCNSGGCSGGGGIYNHQSTAVISNCTLSDNVSLLGGSLISLYGTTTLTHSILAKGASGSNCFTYSTPDAIVSHGYNLSDDASCSAFLFEPGDLNDVAAGLSPDGLQDNGGPTQTIALLVTSPAVDAVPLGACTDANGQPITDQRGISRTEGTACDSGAFELHREPPAYIAQVQQPINADGSSIFNSNRGVVPAKFTLAYGGTATCQLPPATISLFRTNGIVVGPISESAYVLTADSGSSFRVAEGGCQYVYNLATSSLLTGTYAVFISIDSAIVGKGVFGLK